MAGAESSYNAAITNKTGSTAKGLFQFIDKTWEGMGGKPGEQFDPYKNADLGTKYIKNNIDHLRKALGRDPAYHEVYAAHFFGPGVSKMLHNINLSASIEAGLAKFHNAAGVALVMRLNPNLRKKTVGQVIEDLKKKVGDTKVGAGIDENAQYTDSSTSAELPTAPPVKKASAEELASTGRFMIPASGTYSSAFGIRGGGGVVSKDHKGIDIANSVGTPIHAADGGVVVVSSTVSLGYGTRIDIQHDNGMVTRYGHSSKLFVREGERVGKGQVISAMGNEGNSTGPHLHFEVLTATAKRIDPATVIPGLPVAKSRITTEQVALSRSYVDTNFVRVDGKMIALKG
jgi:murein DD-endopeptidase MepM/ murein hydrolase activator NlpD